MLYNPIVFKDEKKGAEVTIKPHAQRRWDERGGWAHNIEAEFRQAAENKRVLNDTMFVIGVCERHGMETFPEFYNTKH